MLVEWKRCGCTETALQLSHHVNGFDTGERDAGSGFRLEAEHGLYRRYGRWHDTDRAIRF